MMKNVRKTGYSTCFSYDRFLSNSTIVLLCQTMVRL